MKKILHEVNQHLKTFNNEYIFIPSSKEYEENSFLVQDVDSAFNVSYKNYFLETSTDTLFTLPFKVEDAKLFFAFLREAKEVEFSIDTQTLTNDKGNIYKLKILTTNELSKELNKYLQLANSLSTIKQSTNIIDGDNSNLVVNGEIISTTIYSSTIADTLHTVISKTANHKLIFSEISTNSITLYPEFSELNLINNFLVLPSKVFRKLKTLKKDVEYFNMYLTTNGIIIEYGVESKEKLILSFNILYDIN